VDGKVHTQQGCRAYWHGKRTYFAPLLKKLVLFLLPIIFSCLSFDVNILRYILQLLLEQCHFSKDDIRRYRGWCFPSCSTLLMISEFLWCILCCGGPIQTWFLMCKGNEQIHCLLNVLVGSVLSRVFNLFVMTLFCFLFL
jgi:hypothetical protein